MTGKQHKTLTSRGLEGVAVDCRRSVLLPRSGRLLPWAAVPEGASAPRGAPNSPVRGSATDHGLAPSTPPSGHLPAIS